MWVLLHIFIAVCTVSDTSSSGNTRKGEKTLPAAGTSATQWFFWLRYCWKKKEKIEHIHTNDLDHGWIFHFHPFDCSLRSQILIHINNYTYWFTLQETIYLIKEYFFLKKNLDIYMYSWGHLLSWVSSVQQQGIVAQHDSVRRVGQHLGYVLGSG